MSDLKEEVFSRKVRRLANGELAINIPKPLRKRIAEFFQMEVDIIYKPPNIIITPKPKEAKQTGN